MHAAIATTYSDVILCRRAEGVFRAGICLFRPADPYAPDDLRSVLHPAELDRYDAFRYEKRRMSYISGRYAAKQALAALLHESDPSRFNIMNGIFNQPVVSYGSARNIQVSISHSSDISAALAFPEVHPMAIDVEKISENLPEVVQPQLTAMEKEHMKCSLCPQQLHATLLWTAKEALSKTLRTGLTAPLHIFEIERVEKNGATYTSYFRFFGQYRAVSITSDSYVCTLLCPLKTEIVVDIDGIRKCFQ